MKSQFIAFIICFPLVSYATLGELAQSACRRKIMKNSSAEKLFSPIQNIDRAEDLVDNGARLERNLLRMEESGLLSGEAASVPWSDSYWPIAQGGLGHRYQDQEFNSYEWQEAFDYIQKNNAQKMFVEGRGSELSPSEKYDLYVGLQGFPFSKAEWTVGQNFLNTSGRVEGWMGSCHGWAAASIMMKEPKRSVDLNIQNKKVRFYPSDIKGLATGLWAKGNFEMRFIGGRCNLEDPARDRYDRERDRNCLDTNPGTWHLAVINQIGISKRSFIMDARSTYEVWNHPVYAYSIKYHNPKTENVERSMRSALVRVQDWNDPRAKVRSVGTKYIVGIRMTVRYGVENEPSTEEYQEDLNIDEEYEYDLELDEKFNILGGEWYSSHPDFLWVPARNTFPGGNPVSFDLINLPPYLKDQASQLAPKGKVLGSIVNELVSKAAKD